MHAQIQIARIRICGCIEVVMPMFFVTVFKLVWIGLTVSAHVAWNQAAASFNSFRFGLTVSVHVAWNLAAAAVAK